VRKGSSCYGKLLYLKSEQLRCVDVKDLLNLGQERLQAPFQLTLVAGALSSKVMQRWWPSLAIAAANMLIDITLPQLDAAAKATIERYYIKAGDTIKPGQPFVMVRSDRFVWDLPATATGTVAELVAQPGTTIITGALLVRLTTADQQSAPQPPRTGRRLLATPLACKIAAVHGLDLATINGSGYGGRIMRRDVLGYVELSTKNQELRAEHQVHSTQKADPNTKLQNLKSDVPYALTAVDVDLSKVLAVLEVQKARLALHGISLLFTACIAHTAVSALTEHRLINSAWSDAGLIVWRRIHLGVMLAAHDELRTTLIQDAATLSLLGLARRLADLARRRCDHMPADNGMVSATFSIAPTGDSMWSHALLLPTQTAHLNIGPITWQPRVIEHVDGDSVAIRPATILTLTYDARVITQPQADAFMCAVKRRLEHLCCL
jgi:2-oxoisovalerate dehydrogenase E2 component (dihydrolipoyl transacylase)